MYTIHMRRCLAFLEAVGMFVIVAGGQCGRRCPVQKQLIIGSVCVAGCGNGAGESATDTGLMLGWSEQ